MNSALLPCSLLKYWNTLFTVNQSPCVKCSVISRHCFKMYTNQLKKSNLLLYLKAVPLFDSFRLFHYIIVSLIQNHLKVFQDESGSQHWSTTTHLTCIDIHCIFQSAFKKKSKKIRNSTLPSPATRTNTFTHPQTEALRLAHTHC